MSAELSDILDPEVIREAVGNNWLNQTKLMRMMPQIFTRQAMPVAGTLISQVRTTIFQGTSGQAVGPNQTISAVGRSQTKASHPVVSRFGSIDDDDAIFQTIAKVPGQMDRNAEYAAACEAAASQWVEDSIIAAIEGTAGALTSNQAGSGATATLALLLAGKAALSDQGTDLDGGGVFMRGQLYWMLAGLGVIAATSNTFGNAAQDAMVRDGKLPTSLLGGTPLASDKFSAAPGTDHYLYFVGPGAINLAGSDTPEIEAARKAALGQFGFKVNLKVPFAVGFNGARWSASGSLTLSDTDLATSGNWALADTDSKYVKLARVLTDND